jgi:dimethylhistidine N-methyltransferase
MSFQDNIIEGLSAPIKRIPSRYFYDRKGDKIFQEIMHMPEYYLTRCEYEIFMTQAADILKALQVSDKGFDLVEFGAGDGYKTKVLIRELLREQANFSYVPIDISSDVLAALAFDLALSHPHLDVKVQPAEYFQALENLRQHSDRPKLVLFIGSSIGNFSEARTIEFLNGLNEKLNPGDQVLIGYDLKKNPHVVLAAYNDAAGITKRFNLNLLTRINRELEANFELAQFSHYASYNPETGFARSLNRNVHFAQGECIHTEISRKYSLKQMDTFLEKSGFRVKKHFKDSRGYFVDTLAEKMP